MTPAFVVSSPWSSVGEAARRLGIPERTLQLYIHAKLVQRLLATKTPSGWFFSIHELEIRRLGAWLTTRRCKRRPGARRKGDRQGKLPFPVVVSTPSKPMPWTFAAGFKPRMARAELTRAYRDARREIA